MVENTPPEVSSVWRISRNRTTIVYIFRLSMLFIQDMSSRVKCSEVLAELTSKFEGISKRECGFVVRECFSATRRIHSNHIYYYTGIRRITTNEYSNEVPTHVNINKGM
jgi:hypothetical protein